MNPANPVFWMAYGHDPEVGLNHRLAAQVAGWLTARRDMAIDRDGCATLKPGQSNMAVHARPTYGGDHTGVGIVEWPGLSHVN